MKETLPKKTLIMTEIVCVWKRPILLSRGEKNLAFQRQNWSVTTFSISEYVSAHINIFLKKMLETKSFLLEVKIINLCKYYYS